MDKKISLEERFVAQQKLSNLPRNSAKVRVMNRCQITGRPHGVYRKLIDSTMINSLGWSKSTSIQNGLKDTYQWFISNYKNIRK